MRPESPRSKGDIRAAGYSPAFWRFYRHDDDVVGLIAYGYYKRCKVEHIRTKKLDRKSHDLDGFDLGEEIEETLRTKAQSFLDHLNIMHTDSTRKKIINEMKADELFNVNSTIKSKLRMREGVKSSFFGSIVFSCFSTIIFLLVVFSNADLRDQFINFVVKKSIQMSGDSNGVSTAILEGLEEQERRSKILTTLVADGAYKSDQPIAIVDAFLEGLDRRPKKDSLIISLTAAALKRSDRPDHVATEIKTIVAPFADLPPLIEPAAGPEKEENPLGALPFQDEEPGPMQFHIPARKPSP